MTTRMRISLLVGLLCCIASCHDKGAPTVPSSAETTSAPPASDAAASPNAATVPSSVPPNAAALATPAPAPLDVDTQGHLQAWYAAVGPRRPTETFGALIVRAGATRLGMPYVDEPSPNGPEMLTCRLDSFECVTFVESTLALSRCIWQGQTDAACFARTLTQLRYRGGRIAGYPSRLHYFEDWMADNAARGLMVLITGRLGGKPVTQPTAYMSDHPHLFPALEDPNNRTAIADVEARISAMHTDVIDREALPKAEWLLEDGDVVAIAIYKPDILVSHTGFISHDPNGVVRLLHASSFRHRVVYSEQDLAQYVLRRPERRGVLVARPLPP